MSRSGQIAAPFGDGIHIFRLDIGQLEELDELTDAGPEFLMNRVIRGDWKLKDIRETIRLGLIGGGMDAMRALAMRDRYAAPGNLLPHKSLVVSILGAALLGAPEEDKGKPAPGEDQGESDRSPEESSGSPTSTKSAGRSASRPKRSRARRSGD